MSVGLSLTSDNQNVIYINDKSFDVGLDYQVRLEKRDSCESRLVDVDDVFFCNNIAKLTLSLPCMPIGEYFIQIIDKTSSETKYELSAKLY